MSSAHLFRHVLPFLFFFLLPTTSSSAALDSPQATLRHFVNHMHKALQKDASAWAHAFATMDFTAQTQATEADKQPPPAMLKWGKSIG